LGTAPLGSYEGGPLWWGPQDRAESVRTIRAAVDAGVGWIDTSPFYGWGLAESLVAEALAGLAERPLVLTKSGTFPPDNRTDNSPAAIRQEVEGSVRRLGVERLDAVQLHDEDPTVPIEESWSALRELVAEGLVGAVGLSNHSVDNMQRALTVGPSMSCSGSTRCSTASRSNVASSSGARTTVCRFSHGRHLPAAT
jgi:aryl-alcohol dehydrogenase-like predicted oxidoreductase